MMPVKFTYTKFTDMANYMDDKNKSVDKLGVVIDAFEKKTITKNSKESIVQKFVLINEQAQTVLLSLWDSFLENEGQVLLTNLHNHPVIITLRIKVNNYNGVALSLGLILQF